MNDKGNRNNECPTPPFLESLIGEPAQRYAHGQHQTGSIVVQSAVSVVEHPEIMVNEIVIIDLVAYVGKNNANHDKKCPDLIHCADNECRDGVHNKDLEVLLEPDVGRLGVPSRTIRDGYPTCED